MESNLLSPHTTLTESASFADLPEPASMAARLPRRDRGPSLGQGATYPRCNPAASG
jgi:hypothetical protein